MFEPAIDEGVVANRRIHQGKGLSLESKFSLSDKNSSASRDSCAVVIEVERCVRISFSVGVL